jgi:biotin carboxyl carrier protein
MKLLTLEGMKMQSNIDAPISGGIAQVQVTGNERVGAKEHLLTIVS